MATVTNGWITLTEKKNGTNENDGMTVQRASGGINASWTEPDEDGNSTVNGCVLKYFQRELYPNGEVCKREVKTYLLENLVESGIDETHYMAPLAVLNGFIAGLGQPQIVNKIRLTLTDCAVLPIDAPIDYRLHDATRQILEREITV